MVWAEVAGFFPSPQAATEAMAGVQASYSAMSRHAALEASQAWRTYRRRGGLMSRVVADLLVAGHALVQSDRLLTRDSGFYRRCYRTLEVLDPTA